MFPYVLPQVQTPEQTETETKLVDDEFIDFKTKFDEINDAAIELKRQQKITTLIDDVIDEKNPFQNLGTEDIWVEEHLFDKNDTKETVEISKNILKDISKNNPFLDFTVPTEQVISDIFDDNTNEELTDNEVTVENLTDDEVIVEYVTDDDLNDSQEPEEIITTPTYIQWHPKITAVSTDKRPRILLSTDYGRKVKVANKIKNKYKKKILRKNRFDKNLTDKRKKASQDWLKAAGYFDTEDQNSIHYIYVPPKKTNQNNIPADASHFIRSEVDSADLKKSNLASKITAKKIVDKYRKAARKKPYTVPNVVLEEPLNTEEIDRIDTIETIEDIATLEPGKNAQLAAKKISGKYKKMREANKRKNKFKRPGEIVRIKTVETSQGDVKVPVSVEKPRSSVPAAKR